MDTIHFANPGPVPWYCPQCDATKSFGMAYAVKKPDEITLSSDCPYVVVCVTCGCVLLPSSVYYNKDQNTAPTQETLRP